MFHSKYFIEKSGNPILDMTDLLIPANFFLQRNQNQNKVCGNQNTIQIKNPFQTEIQNLVRGAENLIGSLRYDTNRMTHIKI